MKTIKIVIFMTLLWGYGGCKSSKSIENDDVYASSKSSKKGSEMKTALNYNRHIAGKLSIPQLQQVHFTLNNDLTFTGSVVIPDVSVVNGVVVDKSRTEIRSGKISKGIKGTIKDYTIGPDGSIERIMISFSKKHSKYQRMWFRCVHAEINGQSDGGYFYLEGTGIEDNHVFWSFSPGYLYEGWDLWNRWPCLSYNSTSTTVDIEEGDAEGDY